MLMMYEYILGFSSMLMMQQVHFRVQFYVDDVRVYFRVQFYVDDATSIC